MSPTSPVKPNSCVQENQITSQAGEYHIWKLEIPTEMKKPKFKQEQVQTNEEHLTKNKRENGREEKKGCGKGDGDGGKGEREGERGEGEETEVGGGGGGREGKREVEGRGRERDRDRETDRETQRELIQASPNNATWRPAVLETFGKQTRALSHPHNNWLSDFTVDRKCCSDFPC